MCDRCKEKLKVANTSRHPKEAPLRSGGYCLDIFSIQTHTIIFAYKTFHKGSDWALVLFPVLCVVTVTGGEGAWCALWGRQTDILIV